MDALADRNLLFGLLALQNGIIDQSALVVAFSIWTRDKVRSLAEILLDQKAIDEDDRAALSVMAARHLRRHGGDAGKSLGAVPTSRLLRQNLAGLADPDIEATLGHVSASSKTEPDAEATSTYGAPLGDGRRFRILRPHAKGGLGEVFVALDDELHREVALKQILDHHADDPISRTRFVLEAEITGGLEHPGIVAVYGLGSHGDGRPYYAMRFIRGDSLKEAIAAFHADESLKNDPGKKSLALRKLLRRFVNVCNAIDYAHGRGILHRDLKPANVIVGKHGETLVVDWGLAKAMGHAKVGNQTDERTLMPRSASGSAETLPGSALGTPAYMSPEQSTGDLERLSPRSDVYSLGATLYCLLTGKAPFEGEDLGVILRAVQKGDFPKPRQVDPSIDRAIEAVCLKSMATNPENRHATARALADDVDRWTADEPTSAWREPFTRRARRWARRNRTLVMAASATGLMALAGLAAALAVQTQANLRLHHANLELGISNAKVTLANTDLNAANDRERQRFDLAVEAIRRYHTDVSEDFLLKQDQFKELRDRLLRDAVGFYRKLEGLLSGQADMRSRRALGRAYEEVGELTDKIGSIQEALEAHQRSLQLRRELAAQEPSAEVAVKADVGRSLIAIGDLFERTGQYDPSLASLEEARSVLSGLAAFGIARDSALHDIARSYYHSGVLLRGIDQAGAGVVAYRKGIAIEEELAARHPEWLDSRRILSWCHNDIGNMMVMEGRHSEALSAYEEARRIKRKLVDDHPGVDEYRRDLAITEGNIGIIFREIGSHEKALESFAIARAILADLAKKHPAHSLLQYSLAYGFTETGEAHRMGSNWTEAEQSYKHAIEIFETLASKNKTVTDYPMRLIQTLKGLGATQLADRRPAQAVASWRRAIVIGEELSDPHDETIYWLAGCHALLGGLAGKPGSDLSAEQGRAELDQAMSMLRKAVTAGYRSVAWMQRDPDLGSLCSRPDFRLLMDDLAFPADPFAR